ncbi:RRP15-like protein isoform X2 [Pieris brassicae]|uniref:RRP15-like protein isoform X2 n=1 Tax=Pieris brassicae TaxID=7116 RepID=UPI001E660F77|nr:RRP15-like protein isoform X2 [Pieris brassicae]
MVIAERMSKSSVKVSDSSSADDASDPEYEAGVSDSQSGSADEQELSNDEVILKNEGWADSLAKILGSTKPKNKKTLVLSRAKKHSEVIKQVKEEKPSFEVVGENIEDIKPEVKEEGTTEEPFAKKRKHEKPSIRVKPNILEKDRERLLAKIATKGVVQLFNAVRNQQKTFEKELNSDVTETKREKVLKKFDKRSFLDSLMGQTKSIVVDESTKSTKEEVKTEEKPKWNALRDDFMMGAKMKDWDKESVEE